MIESQPSVESPEHSLRLAPSIVRNRYHVIAIGSVRRDVVHYQAQDIPTGRPITLELLRDEFAGDPQFVAAVRGQAAKLARVMHRSRYLAEVYECDTTDAGDLFVALEHIEGLTLGETLDDGGVIDAATALQIASRVGEALETLHRHGIVHGELTPDSVVMVKDDDGNGDIEDIKLVGVELAAAHRTVIGLPLRRCGLSELAPEQAHGEPTEASDVYALGKLLQQLVNGRRKTDAMAPAAAAPPELLVVQTIITKALHPLPRERYSNISVMLNEIWSARAQLRPAELPSTSQRIPVRRRPSFSSICNRRALAYGVVIGAVAASLTVSDRIVSHVRDLRPRPELISAPGGVSPAPPRFDGDVDAGISSVGQRTSTTLDGPTAALDTSAPKPQLTSIQQSNALVAVHEPLTSAPPLRVHRHSKVNVRLATETTGRPDSSVGTINRLDRTADQPHGSARETDSEGNMGDGSAIIDWLLNGHR